MRGHGRSRCLGRRRKCTSLALRQAETGVKVAEAALERGRSDRGPQPLRTGARREPGEIRRHHRQRPATPRNSPNRMPGHRWRWRTAQLEQARAALDLARKHLRDTVIHAPVAGVIQKKFVNNGRLRGGSHGGVRRGGQQPPGAGEPGGLGGTGARPARSARHLLRSTVIPGVVFEGRVVDARPGGGCRDARRQGPHPGGQRERRLKAGMFARRRDPDGRGAQRRRDSRRGRLPRRPRRRNRPTSSSSRTAKAARRYVRSAASAKESWR